MSMLCIVGISWLAFRDAVVVFGKPNTSVKDGNVLGLMRGFAETVNHLLLSQRHRCWLCCGVFFQNGVNHLNRSVCMNARVTTEQRLDGNQAATNTKG
jgi:hypothetical protein